VVKTSALELADEFVRLVSIVEDDPTGNQAIDALTAFIVVRRGYVPEYGAWNVGVYSHLASTAGAFIADFLDSDRRGGRLGQAAVAGLIDSFLGSDAVLIQKINDPDRRFPGDIGILDNELDQVLVGVEVRHKTMSLTDACLFARKCADSRVPSACIVVIRTDESSIDEREFIQFSREHGISARLFEGIESLYEECFLWSRLNEEDFLVEIHASIRERLIGIEAGESAVSTWDEIFKR